MPSFAWHLQQSVKHLLQSLPCNLTARGPAGPAIPLPSFPWLLCLAMKLKFSPPQGHTRALHVQQTVAPNLAESQAEALGRGLGLMCHGLQSANNGKYMHSLTE